MSASANTDDEDEAFQLPMLGLYADLELGCGSVLLPDEFHQAAPESQRRILADWQRGLAAIQARLGGVPAAQDAQGGTGASAGSADEPVAH